MIFPFLHVTEQGIVKGLVSLSFFISHLFFQDGLMFLTQLVGFTAKVVSLGLQLFVQSELMFVHLRLEFVLQRQQLFLVLPPHALVSGHLLPQS